jgi:site-specific recombinase XerD
VFIHTLDRNINLRKIPRVKFHRSFPDLPTKAELQKFFDSAPSLMYKAILMTIYGSGLRISEVSNLKISDIDSNNMRILVRQGKGKRDRYSMLPEATLNVLREYYRQYRPKEWLFITRNKTKMSVRAIQDAFQAAMEKSGIQKHLTVHTLRHAFATHLLESGVNLIAIKQLLGHIRLDTTAWYAKIADSDVLKVQSPIDAMPKKRGRPRKVKDDA